MGACFSEIDMAFVWAYRNVPTPKPMSAVNQCTFGSAVPNTCGDRIILCARMTGASSRTHDAAGTRLPRASELGNVRATAHTIATHSVADTSRGAVAVVVVNKHKNQ